MRVPCSTQAADQPVLRKLLQFFTAYQPTGLLEALPGEQKRDRRRLMLLLLEIHGAAAREAAFERLTHSLGPAVGEEEWYFRRNLLYLLRRIPRGPDSPPLDSEIDVEYSSKDADTLYLVNWLNTDPSSDPTPDHETYTAIQPFDAPAGFHTYTFVWEPGLITFYIDGQPQAGHATNVPTAPGYFMINHWGTNSSRWGGPATVGEHRFLYVDRVSYTPLD